MGKKCCIPKCNSTNDPKVSCFQFPSENKKLEAWLKLIPRNDKFKTKHLGVCILHFEMKYIKVVNEDGIPLKRPRLTNDAIPTLFNATKDGVPDVFCYDFIDHEQQTGDLIKHFQSFKNEFVGHIKQKNWLTTSTESNVTIFNLKREVNGNLVVRCCVNIDNNLKVQVFFENNLLDDNFHKKIIHHRQRLNLYSELNSLLVKCDSLDAEDSSDSEGTIKKFLKFARQNVSDAKRVIESSNEFEFANCVNIIHDQLVQLTENRRRFSINTILCAYVIYIQSSKAYELIREYGVLILPSIVTLQTLSRFQDVDPNNKSSNISYLKKIVANLSDHEKFVVIQLDEIYSNPQVNFWHQLTGFAENKDEVATTVLGVMITSCFGRMKEIVNLIPMKDATGEDLKRYALDVIESLQSIGFIILALITDNNRVNQCFFSLLDPSGTYCIQNPTYPERKIRLLYDTIHILKNIRSNWVNKKDEEKSLFYPKFEDFFIIQQAAFKDLRDLYHSEKLKMVKTAPKLNSRSLYPTRFDRQKVPLVLNLIHPSTIAALIVKGDTDTAEFLQIIQTWFSIVNNRSPMKGISRIEWIAYNNHQDSFDITFLKKFVDWLISWRDLELNLRVGGLTKDTFQASICTSQGLICLIFESFMSISIEVFLCGMIQTNDLEKRFGRYRNLSGCNYNVSVKQIMESEKKLRIKTLVSKFPNELNNSKYAVKSEAVVDLTPFSDLIHSQYIANFKEYDYGSFMYVCGYGGHTLFEKLRCQVCCDLIIKSEGSTSGADYFDLLQNGTRIVPTENCVTLLLHMYALFNALRKDEEKRRLFQFSDSPRSILVNLTLEGVSLNGNFVVDWEDSCLCGTVYIDLFTPLLSIYANIILNNYRKKINDMVTIRKIDKSNKRKTKIGKELEKPNRKASTYNKM